MPPSSQADNADEDDVDALRELGVEPTRNASECRKRRLKRFKKFLDTETALLAMRADSTDNVASADMVRAAFNYLVRPPSAERRRVVLLQSALLLLAGVPLGIGVNLVTDAAWGSPTMWAGLASIALGLVAGFAVIAWQVSTR